jgi:glycosyltransferase involved in cell wall biosynthesis
MIEVVNAPKYSVLLPVYYKDVPEFLKISINSMLSQTLPPDEIVIAIDGTINNDLSEIIMKYKEQYPSLFSIYSYEVSEGLGSLLMRTLPLCRNEYVVRMDADDYSFPNRIEKQFAILKEHPDIDIVGSNVDEFEVDFHKPIAHVILPEMPDANNEFAKKRCPMRHPTLLYKKQDVINTGNYKTMFSLEDYDLIVRMQIAGLKLYNIQEPLVLMRVSNDFYKRRGGINYLKCVINLKTRFFKMGFMSLTDYIISCFGQAIIVLLPTWFRKQFYLKILRR